MHLLETYLLMQRRRRRREKEKRSPGRRLEIGMIAVGMAFSLVVVIVLLGVSAAYGSLTKDLPSLERLPALLNPDDGLLQQPTRIYDRSGRHLLLSLENPGVPRRYLSINPGAEEFLSPRLMQVTIALLEPDFWRSPGFGWRDISSPEPQTIAERLVDRLLLSQEPPGVKRTLYLRVLAAQLVAHYGRAQVLEWYLNSAYFGHLAYGTDSAAWLYLDKPASQLDLPEAAMLVAVGETPALNPLDSPPACCRPCRRQKTICRPNSKPAA